MKRTFRLTTRCLAPMMKVIAIAVAGTFFFQSSALALEYKAVEILPKDDFKDGAVGFGLSVGLPFVAHGLGAALSSGSQATAQGAQISTQATSIGTQAGPHLSNIGQFMLNPSGLTGGYGIAGDAIIFHTATTVGQDLAKAGQLYWGMSPSSAQYLGMVGSSITTFGMGAITNPQGIQGIYGTKFNPAGEIIKGTGRSFVNAHPVTAGMLTGASFGAVTGGINIATQQALKDSVSPGTASVLGSLAGNTLGAGLWGGLTHDLTGSGTNFTEGFKTSLYGDATKEAQKLGLRQFKQEMVLRGLDVGITHFAEKSGMAPQYASIIGSSGEMLVGNITGLRPSTEITNNATLNAVLEPAIYAGSAYAVTKATEGAETPYQAAATNMGTFLLASTISSGIHAYSAAPEKVFANDLKTRLYQFSRDTVTLGAYTGERVLQQRGQVTNYQGALQLSKLWDFAGLEDFALRANQIEELGGDWRSAELVKTPFHSMLNRATGMARYHAVRNTEYSGVYLTRAIAPYELNRHSSQDIRDWLKDRTPEEIAAINQMIMLDQEIPVFDFRYTKEPEPKRAGLTIELFRYGIGIGAENAPIDVYDKFTKTHRPLLPLSEDLAQPTNAISPYQRQIHATDIAKFPVINIAEDGTVSYAQPQIAVEDTSTQIKEQEANIIFSLETVIATIRDGQLPKLNRLLEGEPTNLSYLQELKDAEQRLLKMQEELRRVQAQIK